MIRTTISFFLLLGFLYLLNSGQCVSEDVNLGIWQMLMAYSAMKCIFSQIENHVYLHLFNIFKTIFTYGWIRVLIFIGLVSVLAYFFVVVVLDRVFNLAVDYSSEIVSRFESNIIELHEERIQFEKTVVHPITKGLKEPILFQQIFRYPMEDVKVKCHVRVLWFSHSRLHPGYIVWRKDGVEMNLSERHRHEITFKEVLESDTYFAKKGLSWYNVISTITIYLLQDNDFGTYTCHKAKVFEIAVGDFLARSEMLSAPKCHEQPSPPKRPVVPKPPAQCPQVPMPLPQFQDEYTWHMEIRLIRMDRRQEIIALPPGAILSFKTSYWHLSRNDEVDIEYTVNDQDYFELCNGLLRGCSKFLSLYWKIMHNLGYFGIPPLHLFTTWRTPCFSAKQYQLVHCICEQAYGYHQVRYLRRYFNHKLQKYELIDIDHPHQLIVIPRKQDMLDIYTNSSFGPVFHKTKEHIQKQSDSDSVGETASAVVELFTMKETFIIVVICLLISFFTWLCLKILCRISRFIKRQILERGIDNLISIRKAREFEYDIFLSYSDAEVTQVKEIFLSFLETRGFRVFERERDIPGNVQELPALGEAMEKSKMFLLIMTESYFNDRFRRDFEAAIILECVYSRCKDPKEVLIVKLHPCQIPMWLSQFHVLNWTPNICLKCRQRHLMQWLASRDCKRICGTWAAAGRTVLFVAGFLLLLFAKFLL